MLSWPILSALLASSWKAKAINCSGFMPVVARAWSIFVSALPNAFIVVEETDQSGFWLDLLHNSGVCTGAVIQPLKAEADELLRIFSTSLNTAKANAGR